MPAFEANEIANQLQLASGSGSANCMTLDHLPRGTSATIATVHWDALAPDEARRLRALGIDEGAEVRVAHRGVFAGSDPIAVTVGRMTVALRRAHAAAMEITTGEAKA